MSIDDGINGLVLQEFRLRDADTASAAAEIVAAFSGGIGPAVPLLTSIDDPRDVATVRALHEGETTETDPAERAELDPLVASWQPPKEYRPRITERSGDPSSHYRLAVTGSGINNAEPATPAALHRSADEGNATPLGLLWIGLPVGTYAGLMVLLGSNDDRDKVAAPRNWPLDLSRSLGVRIYESVR